MRPPPLTADNMEGTSDMIDNKHETKQNASHTPGPWFLQNGNEIHDKDTRFDESSARIGETPNLIATVDFFNTEANGRLIVAAPELLEAAETALSRFAWVIDLVSKAVGHMNVDDIPQEAIALLDEVTSSEYFKDDIESVQLAIAEAKGIAA
jgi:hypothetical protein